jgi:hypothetical protein
MRDICFLKFGNTSCNALCASDDFCKVKTVYSSSIIFSKFGFRFILVSLQDQEPEVL